MLRVWSSIIPDSGAVLKNSNVMPLINAVALASSVQGHTAEVVASNSAVFMI